MYFNAKNMFAELSKFKYANIKGEALSKQAYGQVAQRIISDIDILISRLFLSDFYSILTNNEFISSIKTRENHVAMMSYSHQASPWVKNVKPWGIIHIDINFSLFWGEYDGVQIDVEDFLSDTVEIDIYNCKVKTLTPAKALIQLCLHHYKDMNSIFLLATRNSIKHVMFKDVYHLLINNLDSIPIDQLYYMCAEYEIIPYVYYVLYHTGLIYDNYILRNYISKFETHEGRSLINYYGLTDTERKQWRYDFESRLACGKQRNLYNLIESDLTKRDKDKIELNKRVFLGG